MKRSRGLIAALLMLGILAWFAQRWWHYPQPKQTREVAATAEG